jgi:predicted GTPase
MAEARGKLTGHLFDQLSTSMQLQLKRAALQEAASVAIDLYSKRFELAHSELGTSKAVLRDERLQAPPIEPLRVVFVGQLSAGKSSLINGLMGTLSAEVSTLPTTSGVTLYQCKLEGIDLLHLVDLPGLDGTEVAQTQALEQMTQSDLVIWVLQANQPARSLDKKLKARFDAFYLQQENRSRRKPTVVAAISQVDRLRPATEWAPPYDLEQGDSPVARLIRDAVAYNQELLEPDLALAVAAGADQPGFNIDRLEALITEAYQQGVNTQLNRRRHEDSGPLAGQQVRRLLQLGKTMWRQAGSSSENPVD